MEMLELFKLLLGLVLVVSEQLELSYLLVWQEKQQLWLELISQEKGQLSFLQLYVEVILQAIA